MPRYIDADLLMKEFCDFVRPSNNSDFAPVPTWNDAMSIIENAPTADVVGRHRYALLLAKATIVCDAWKEYQTADYVKVVRCKDCANNNGRWCRELDMWIKEDEFCSRGERRTDADN